MFGYCNIINTTSIANRDVMLINVVVNNETYFVYV